MLKKDFGLKRLITDEKKCFTILFVAVRESVLKPCFIEVRLQLTWNSSSVK